MGRRQLNPTSKKFDDRMVVRKQEAFNYGMVTDMSAIDIPYNAVTMLKNARGHKNCIRGRTGSRKFTNLQLPTLASLVCSLASGRLTRNGGITSDLAGSTGYVTIGGEVHPILVSERVDDSTLNVSTETHISSFENLLVTFKPKVNAQFFDSLTKVRYFLLGSKLYARVGRDEVWNEYFIIGTTPLDALSEIYKIGNKLILTNPNGIYVINSIYDGMYAWRANDAMPTYKLNSPYNSTPTTSGSTYRHIYTYSRMTGAYTGNRLNGQNIIEVETPPVNVTNKIEPISGLPLKDYTNDYDQINIGHPISDCKFQRFTISTAQIAGIYSYRNYQGWIHLTENNYLPILGVTIGADTTYAYLNFATVENMEDVASAIERSLYDISDKFRVLYTVDAGVPYFDIWNTDPSVVWNFSNTTPSLTPAPFNLFQGGVISSYALSDGRMGAILKTFKYPIGLRKDITHYSVYRTKDVYPTVNNPLDITDPRIVNNPDIYGWVADVPVCEFINGTVTLETGVYYLTLTNPNSTIIGGTYTATGQTFIQFTVMNETSVAGKYKIVFGFNATQGSIKAYTGAVVCSTASKVGNNVTGVGTNWTSNEVGRVLFWEDGTCSIVKSFISPTQLVTVDSFDKPSQFVLTQPNERTYYDTVTDNIRDGYLSVYPLKTRFFQPLPNATVTAYHNGILAVAQTDTNKLYYSDTELMQFIGYNSPEQFNDKVQEGIRCIFIVNDLFAVLTTSSTYTVNTRQSNIIESGYGEVYTIPPDPFLVNGSIGASNQFRISQGEKGDVMIVTSEPAVRFFNGSEYSANMANERIQETHIQLLNDNIIASYSPTGGIHIWGYRSDLYDN